MSAAHYCWAPRARARPAGEQASLSRPESTAEQTAMTCSLRHRNGQPLRGGSEDHLFVRNDDSTVFAQTKRALVRACPANRLVPYRSLGAEINWQIELSGRGTTVRCAPKLSVYLFPLRSLSAPSAGARRTPPQHIHHQRLQGRRARQPPRATAPHLRATMGGGHDLPTTPATRTEMADANLAVAYRDACAHLLIPLNKCRRKTFYMPWECGHLRHEYERCQYVEWLKRSKDETVRAAAAADGGGGRGVATLRGPS